MGKRALHSPPAEKKGGGECSQAVGYARKSGVHKVRPLGKIKSKKGDPSVALRHCMQKKSQARRRKKKKSNGRSTKRLGYMMPEKRNPRLGEKWLVPSSEHPPPSYALRLHVIPSALCFTHGRKRDSVASSW